MVQWIGIRLPTQGTLVRSWSGKIPHALEQISLGTTTPEPCAQSLRSETRAAIAMRGLRTTVKSSSAHLDEKAAPLLTTRGKPAQQ